MDVVGPAFEPGRSELDAHPKKGTTVAMYGPNQLRIAFLECGSVVRAALTDAAVIDAWDEPSTLDDQTVGALAAHLVRSGVTIVADALLAEAPVGAPDFDDTVDYFVKVLASLDGEGHAAGRRRSAAAASLGSDDVVADLRARHAELHGLLAAAPEGRMVAVPGRGTIDVDHFLGTRLVEAVVHLDDLARSIGRTPWEVPDEAHTWITHVGAELGRRRHGNQAMLRTLYREGPDGATLPVL